MAQGDQTRVFQTDSLGRTVMVQQPESGTTTYSYGWSSTSGLGLTVTRTRPAANQTSSSVLTSTSTQYDSVGRVTSISYANSDQSPTLTLNRYFSYDTATGWHNQNLGASKGRMTFAQDGGTAAEMFVYGPMGRVTKELECMPGWCGGAGTEDKWLDYTYDQAGNVISATDGAGVTATYTYSPAAEVQSITSSLNDGTHPGALVSNVVNGPDGPVSYQLGNGLSVYRVYDPLGRVQAKYVCNGPAELGCGDLSKIVQSYWINWRGSEVTYSDELEAGEQTYDYTYDEFDRLATMTNHPSGQQLYNWVYDRYGNRWQQNPQQGGQSSSLTFNPVNNRITSTGYVYDVAGNLTQDPEHSYQYDADGNLVEVDGGVTATYTYNPLGRRVGINEGGNEERFVFNLAGQRMAIWNFGNGIQIQGEKYWGSMPVEFDWHNQANFPHVDWQGTIRAVTSYSASVEGATTSLPYGDGSGATGSGFQPWQFAQLDKDYYANANSGTDHAQFRQYGDEEGRWMSPDSYLGSYNFTNPESFNRYAYVMNDPLSFEDPSGEVGEGPALYIGTSICGPACGVIAGIGVGVADLFGGLGHLLGWWGGPEFHGSLKPRPGLPQFNFRVDTWSSGLPSAGPSSEPYTFKVYVTAAASTLALNSQWQPKPPQSQQPKHFWQKPGCSDALGELGVGLVGSVLTTGAIVAAFVVGPEELVGVEGAVTVLHVAPVGVAGFILTAYGGVGVARKCF